MSTIVYALLLLAALAFVLVVSYLRWQQLTERDRFMLGMKAASHPENLTAEQRSTLKVVRSPWWAVWRWVPDLWRRRPLDLGR